MRSLLQVRMARLGILTVLVGCVDHAAGPPQDGTVLITISTSTGTLSLRVGDSLQLSVKTSEMGSYTTEWLTLTPEKVTVDHRGMARGLSPGAAAVVARLRYTDGRKDEGRVDLTVLP